MKHVLALIVLVSFTAPLRADSPPPGPPPTRMWSKLSVQSIKPTLSARNVYVIRGIHQHGVRGGWTIDTSYAISAATKVVQIKLAASAPHGMATTRDIPVFETKVEIAELKGPEYSGAPGKFDVVVVDRDGKELARTIYDIP
jgi:hypothetical protein